MKSFRESMKYVMERVKGPMTVVEIGVFQGGNALRLLKLNLERLYLVDPYKTYNQYKADKIAYVQAQLDEAQNIMRERISNHPLKDKVTIIIKDSIEGSKEFEDEFFDYVYIDGNHSYGSVQKDLEAWYPKVKKGGFLAGHDYITMPTAKAVNEFADKKGLTLISWCKPGQVNVDDWKKDWLIQKPE
jgi:predicted O-methyltransferase YrrM